MSFFSFGESMSLKLEEILPKAILRDLKNCSYEELAFYHFTLGEYFRNVILDEKGELYRCFYYDLEIHKKDDMSQLMLEMLYLHLKGSINDPFSNDPVESYRHI